MNTLASPITNDLPTAASKNVLYRVPRWLLAALASLTPTIMTFALVSGYLKRNLFDFKPILWNDQTYYWHQILTFSRVGFNGGYYMFYEKLPRLDFFHFGASGFLYPALYGTLAHLVGWEMVTGILLNMLGLGLACCLVIYVADFDQLQIILTGLLLLAVGPVLLYIVTISQESFHQAAALVLAAIFYRLLQRKGVSGWFIAASIGFLVLISLVRFSWTLLFFPFCILAQKRLSWRSILASCFISGLFMVAVLFTFQNTSAPGNNSVFIRAGQFTSSPFAAIESLWNAVLDNLKQMLTVNNLHQLPIDTIEFVQFFVVLLCLVLGSRLFIKQESHSRISSSSNQQLFVHIFNLLSILAASLLFYLSNGYYRVLAPHILLSGVLLIAFKNVRLVIVLLIISLFGVGLFLNEYAKWGNNFISNSPDNIAALNAPFEQVLTYNAGATNPWCNTLLTQIQFLETSTISVPAGIGISFFLSPAEQPIPIKSHYLLLDDHSYEVLHDRAHLTLLASVTGGNLYRNLDANCPNS